ncbi:MAG TPA: HAD hydrolase family protein [Candidatus Polarisedimenticolaceae bacterium]
MTASSEVDGRARRVRLVVLDADGVMTDGRITVFADGNESRNFFSRDGLAVKIGQRAGLRFAVISGRTSKVVDARARELGFVECLQGIHDKGATLRELAARQNVALDEVAFVGDDLVDLPAMRLSGFAAAPADADAEARAAAHWVTPSPGGRGAVRDFVELVLRAQGTWERITAAYHGRD